MKTTTLLFFTLLLHALLHAQSTVTLSRPDSTVVTVDGRALEILEMGGLLTALGKHEEAHQYFRFVLRDFDHPEIRNNTGLSAVLEALYYFRPYEPEVKFRYPLELDLHSAGAKSFKDFKELRTHLLRQAIAHFDTAILLDPQYAPAYLNRACAFALLGDNQSAQLAVGEVQRNTNQAKYAKTATDLQVLLGILYERQGDTTKAQGAFKTAAEQGSQLGAYNLKILLKQPVTSASTPPLFGGTEAIDGNNLNNPYKIPELEPNSEIILGPQLKFYHNLHPGANSRFYFSENSATGQQTYFLLTGTNYTGQTARQLKIGAGHAKIDAAYGKPKRVLDTINGQIMVYPAIILMVDKDGRLKQWAIYGEEG